MNIEGGFHKKIRIQSLFTHPHVDGNWVKCLSPHKTMLQHSHELSFRAEEAGGGGQKIVCLE